MRFRLLIPFICVAALAGGSPARAQGWSRTFDSGTSWDDVAWAGPVATGRHLSLGSTDILPGRFGDAAVIRLDERGQLIQAHAHGTDAREGVAGAVPTSDGGALLCGATTHFFDFRLGFVARVAPSGALAWAKELQAPTATQVITAFGVTELLDGGLAVVGSFSEIDAPPRHAFVMVLEADGALRWQRMLSAGEFEQAQAVVQSADGSLWVAGLSVSASGAGDSDAWVVKLTIDGDLVWARAFGSIGRDEATAIVRAPGDGALIAGFTDGLTTSGHSPWLLRLDVDGALLWQRVAGDVEWGEARGLLPTPDGGGIVLGRLDIPGSTSIDLWLARFTADGSSLWQRAFDSGQGDWGISVTSGSDGGLVLGAMSAWGFPEQDSWLLRTDGEGRIDCRQARDVDVLLVEPRIEQPATNVGIVPVDLAVQDAGWTTVDLPVTEAVACDACADAGGAAPGEPSAAAPWLRAWKQPTERVVVEEVPEATALNLYVDRIGSWYAPSAATGTRCRETAWTSLGDGTLSIDTDLPAGSWIAVAASNACGESSAGRDSFGVERRSRGTWEACPPGP